MGRKEVNTLIHANLPSIVCVMIITIFLWVVGFIVYSKSSELYGLVLMWCGTGIISIGLVFWMR
jgi:hypothetical protein